MRVLIFNLIILLLTACTSNEVEVEFQYYVGKKMQKTESGFLFETDNNFSYYLNSDTTNRVSELKFDGNNLYYFGIDCPLIDTIIIDELSAYSFFVYKYDMVEEHDDEEFIVATKSDGILVKYSYVWDTFCFYKTDSFDISVYETIIRHLKDTFDMLPPIPKIE